MAGESGARRLLDWARANWIPLAHLALCAAVIAPISARPGWPLAHDGYPLFQRVEAFRREFAAGNLFPLWTPFGNEGHGMPMPFFYHRLFNTAAGLLALLVGAPAAVKVAFVPTLAVGSAGMSAAAAELGAPPWLRFWSGAMLPLAHYTFVNWLIRGSAAELTAGMLLPWLIVVCLRLQSGKPFGVRLGVMLILLFYAHAAIALFSTFLIAVAVIGRLIRQRAAAPAVKDLSRGLGVALAIVAIGAGPYAAGIALIKPEFSLDRFSVYLPQHQISPWVRYLIDDFAWGQTWQGLSIEIGRFLIAALLVGIVIVLAKRARLQTRAFAFLATSSLVYFWFQLPVSRAFYEAVKLSQILQFPWRLLVFITPLVILMVAVLAHAVLELGGRWAHAVAGILAGAWAAQASFAMAPYRARYEWMSPRSIEADFATLEVQTGAGEFRPKSLGDRPNPPRTETVRLEGCTLVSSNVDLRTLDKRPFETLILGLESASGCTVHFSQFWTTFIRVRPSPGGRAVRAPDETTDILLPPGPSGVTIDRRGLWSAIWARARAASPP